MEVFGFRDAAELRTSQTRQYYNGAYTGTTYTYTWSDVGGRKRYVITGRHKSEKASPPSTDPYQFGRAAEIAWTIYLLDETYRAIELRGTVLFNLTGGQWLRLGQGYMIVSTSGDGEQWNADEIAIVTVAQGVVRIKRPRTHRRGGFRRRACSSSASTVPGERSVVLPSLREAGGGGGGVEDLHDLSFRASTHRETINRFQCC